MKVWYSGTAWLGFSAALLLVAFGKSAAQAEPTLTANEIVHKAVARGEQPETKPGQQNFTYTKVTLTEELDATGKVKERHEKVYSVSLRDGSTHLKLLEVNGHAPDEADLKKQAESDVSARQMLGQGKAGKGVTRDNFLTPELVARFDFTLVEQAPINGRMAYQLRFQPKNPEPPVRRVVDRLLNRISGTLWIDAEEFEVARADVQLRSEVNFLGGMIGSLKKLAYTMTRTRIAEGFWMGTSSSGDFEGRKLIDALRVRTHSQSINFRAIRATS